MGGITKKGRRMLRTETQGHSHHIRGFVIKEGSTKIIGQRVMYHVYSFVV
jgi:hypothetical protein